jgi:predicted phage-related endonuclease
MHTNKQYAEMLERGGKPQADAAKEKLRQIVMPTKNDGTGDAVTDPERDWHVQRRSFVGGSEVFELLNVPQYGRGCVRALAYRKLGHEPDYRLPSSHEDLFARGHLLEPLVATIYEGATGRKLRRPAMDDAGHPIPKRNSIYPWAGVNTDRLILAGSGGIEETGDLEIKTRGEGPWWRVKRLGPQTGDILQPQWSNFVTGHSWSSLAELGVFGSLPMLYFDREADLELFEIFKREGDIFADKVFVHGELPEPPFLADDPRCRVCAYRLSCRGQEIDLAEATAVSEISLGKHELVQIDNADLAHTLAEVDLLKEESKALQEAIDVAKEQVLEQLGNAEAAKVRGYGRVYKVATQANYFDAQRFKSDQPTVYEKYMVRRKTGGFYIRAYPDKL